MSLKQYDYCALSTDDNIDTAFPNPDELPDEAHDKARKSYEWRLLSETLKVALQRPTDINTLPHIHVMLVFFSRLASIPLGIPGVTSHLPLPQLVTFLNTLVSLIKPGDEILQDLFVTPKKPYCHPLPEDYAIRGQLWSNGYFPLDWFESASSDHDERYMEQDPKHVAHLRAQRILWLAVRLASASPSSENLHKQQNSWLCFNPNTKFFSINDRSEGPYA